MVAALVRIADELDEDYRRADPKLQEKIGIAADSEFYWAFCQRIRAVRPQRLRAEIDISVKFEVRDALWKVRVVGKTRLFISAFAEKLAKINRERVVVNQFLPEQLRYRRIVVSIKPSAGSSDRASPREFIFSDETLASQFVKELPELTVQPINDVLSSVLGQIRDGKLEEAEEALQGLEEVLDDLHTDARLRILWNHINVCSLRAEILKGKKQERLLDRGLQYLNKWYEFGLNVGWRELGYTPSSQIFRIADDRDVKFLYQRRRAEIDKMLGKNRNCLEHYSGFGAGGCIPAGAEIDAPEGPIKIENLWTGAVIFSASLTEPLEKIRTTVTKIYRSVEERCVRINNEHVFTWSQPLYSRNGNWIRAHPVETQEHQI